MKLPDKPHSIGFNTWASFKKTIEVLRSDYNISFVPRPDPIKQAKYIAKARAARGKQPSSYYATIGRKGARSRWGEPDPEI